MISLLFPSTFEHTYFYYIRFKKNSCTFTFLYFANIYVTQDMMILDFLVTINPLIDSDDWLNEVNVM